MMPSYDLLIANATLVDGTGAPGRQGSVAVRDDSIVAVGEYLDTLANNGVGINVAALVGHGAVRKATMGYAMRAPDAAELGQIRVYVAESMAGGAFGMSFGGIYPPSNYAQTEELIEASRE